MHTRREGKFAAFTVGIGVIFVYYAVMFVFENLAKSGDFPAVWARWVPNILLGAAGMAMLWRRTHGAGWRLPRLPIGAWLRGPLRDWADPLVAPSALDAAGFDAAAVTAVWQRHLAGQAEELRLWPVLMFQAWREQWG